MKLTVEQRELDDKLSIVKEAVATKKTMPILQGVFISGNQVVATDLELGIKTSLECEVAEKGAAVFPSRIFSIVKELPDSIIEITVDKNFKAKLECNGIEIELDCYDYQEYPDLPKVEKPSIMTVNSHQLEKAIRNTKVAVLNDDSQPALTGIYFDDGNTVATNTYRLAKYQSEIQFEESIILPEKAAKAVENICNTGEIKVEYSSNYVKFILNDTTIFSRLIEGEFPNYPRVIPDESNTTITLNTQSLKSCLKRAKTVDTDTGIIRLISVDDSLKVKLQADNSQFEELLSAEVEGENQTINLDISYLLDGVKLLQEDKTQLELLDGVNPAVLREGNLTYLIMPIRSD